MATCKNCSTVFDGKYCTNCRQAAETNRLTWYELTHHLLYAIFHTNIGVLFTIKELTVRPGHTIREYIAEKRGYHFNPFLFLILGGGLASILYVSMHVAPLNSEIELEKIKALSEAIAYKYFALVGALIIVLFSVVDYFFFFKRKYIMPEIFVSNIFQVGQIMVFTVAVFPLLLLQKHLNAGIDFEVRLLMKIALLGYLFFVRYQFYEAKGNALVVVKILIELAVIFAIYDYVVAGFIVRIING